MRNKFISCLCSFLKPSHYRTQEAIDTRVCFIVQRDIVSPTKTIIFLLYNSAPESMTKVACSAQVACTARTMEYTLERTLEPKIAWECSMTDIDWRVWSADQNIDDRPHSYRCNLSVSWNYAENSVPLHPLKVGDQRMCVTRHAGISASFTPSRARSIVPSF